MKREMNNGAFLIKKNKNVFVRSGVVISVVYGTLSLLL